MTTNDIQSHNIQTNNYVPHKDNSCSTTKELHTSQNTDDRNADSDKLLFSEKTIDMQIKIK